MKLFKFFRRNNPLYGLVGIYMIYLVYTMIKDFSEAEGNVRIATCIAIPVFAAFGILLVVGYVLGQSDEQKAKAEAAEQEAAEQEAMAGEEDITGNLESAEEKASRSGFAKVAAVLDQLENDDEE